MVCLYKKKYLLMHNPIRGISRVSTERNLFPGVNTENK